jgi:hypothetical protein
MTSFNQGLLGEAAAGGGEAGTGAAAAAEGGGAEERAGGEAAGGAGAAAGGTAAGGGGVVDMQQTLGSSLLPGPGYGKSQGWLVGDHTLWYAPLKPLTQLGGSKRLLLYTGSWAGLAPGGSLQVTATVLVPRTPQQQQQQDEEEEETAGQPAESDMPGEWHVVASVVTRVVCEQQQQQIRLRGSSLARQIVAITSNYYLLRAHYTLVGGQSLVLPFANNGIM